MHIITANCVNEALAKGLTLIQQYGEETPSRNGMTLEIPDPVTTVYRNPRNRVLISDARDANPFFHFMESLWIIAGRKDVNFLNEFNGRMKEYSDDGNVFNAPYGYRLRKTFGKDQIRSVLNILKNDPNSRQAVMQIWDPDDLDKTTKDKACNMQVVFRVRGGCLDMIVYNRSNDMIWGAYGANIVQFSMLQEYMAAHLDIPMGTYTQVSNSFHVYTEGPGGDLYNTLEWKYCKGYEPYKRFNMLQTMAHEDMDPFESDLYFLFKGYDRFGLKGFKSYSWDSCYFKDLVGPMLNTYIAYKSEKITSALWAAHIRSDDWRLAVYKWLGKRDRNRNRQQNKEV